MGLEGEKRVGAIDPTKAFEQACAFADCAELLETERVKIHATPFARFSAAAAVSAFACELFLKALISACRLSGEESGGFSIHGLNQLFDILRGEDASAVAEIENATLCMVKLEDGYTFDKALRDASDSFIFWRYSYEHGRAKSGVMLLRSMRLVLRDKCCVKLYGRPWSTYAQQYNCH